MHDRDNKNETRFDGVQHGVWKDAREAAANVLLQGGVTRRTFRELPDCRLNACNEALLKPDLLFCVVPSRILKL